MDLCVYHKYMYQCMQLGKCKNDAPSAVECYMKEYGTMGEEAMAAVTEMMEQAWRRMNRDYIEMKGTIKLAAQCLLNLGRSFETFYLHGSKDGLTYGGDVKDLIILYFLKEVHV
jgi:eudesmane-5,11-diol synthase